MSWLHGMIVKNTCRLYTHSFLPGKYNYPPWNQHNPWKSSAGKGDSYWKPPFWGGYFSFREGISIHRFFHPPMAPGSESSDQKSPTGTRTPQDTPISLLLPQVHIPTKKGKFQKSSTQKKKNPLGREYGLVSGRVIYFELSQHQATDSSKEKQW